MNGLVIAGYVLAAVVTIVSLLFAFMISVLSNDSDEAQ